MNKLKPIEQISLRRTAMEFAVQLQGAKKYSENQEILQFCEEIYLWLCGEHPMQETYGEKIRKALEMSNPNKK